MIEIDDAAVEEQFIRSTGPGGQNVNKVESAVQLRYDLNRARFLDDAMRRRLKTLAGRKLSRDGVLIITAHRFRSQERNREDARERLCLAALAYELHSDHGGPAPLETGAMLRIRAKQFAQAVREEMPELERVT